MELAEEVDSLKAIFSPNEFEIINLGSSGALLKFIVILDNVDYQKSHNAEVVLQVPSEYPHVPPTVSLVCVKLKNSQKFEIESVINKYAYDCSGRPMIMDIFLMAKNHLDAFEPGIITEGIKPMETQNVCEKDVSYTTVIQIDHMRSKTKYMKTLKAWSLELHINGVLLFCKRWIFLILQGSRGNVKDYMKRYKTVCIDVDSSGKRCKERMLKILYEGDFPLCFSSFLVEEVESIQELEQYFGKYSLIKIFKDYIKCLIK